MLGFFVVVVVKNIVCFFSNCILSITDYTAVVLLFLRWVLNIVLSFLESFPSQYPLSYPQMNMHLSLKMYRIAGQNYTFHWCMGKHGVLSMCISQICWCQWIQKIDSPLLEVKAQCMLSISLLTSSCQLIHLNILQFNKPNTCINMLFFFCSSSHCIQYTFLSSVFLRKKEKLNWRKKKADKNTRAAAWETQDRQAALAQ